MGSSSSKTPSEVRLDGKTALITGANTGIGKYTVRDFYMRGARIIMACRNLEKAREAVTDIEESCKNEQNLGTIVTTELDLSSLKSIRDCASRLLNTETRIDLLINNAGVMVCPESKTEDGFEMQMGTNHLGHFLLTLLLLPKICQSVPARIVNVSSMAHRGDKIDLDDLNWEKKKYKPFGAYQQSKLANILFTKELDRRLKENDVTGVTTYALHPGAINTELQRHVGDTYGSAGKVFGNIAHCFMKSPEQGIQTTIYCAVNETTADQSGLYYSDSAVKKPIKAAMSEEDAKKLWEISWKLVGLPEDYNPFVPIRTSTPTVK